MYHTSDVILEKKSLQLALILRLYDVAQFVGQNHDKRFAQIRAPD